MSEPTGYERVHTPPPPAPPPPPLPADKATEAAEPEPQKHRSFLRELPVLIVVAFVVALLIKSFLLQAFYIPSASMEPTLVEGDRVLVEKLSYRLNGPERGDVVVFEKDLVIPTAAPQDESWWDGILDSFRGLFGFPTGTEQDFIKRVMAVGGDTIEGRDGRVYVNDELVEEPYLMEGQQTSTFGPAEIPEGKIFVMGDNRNNSDDSRNFGPIEADAVVGHAFLLIWPPNDFDTL
ncbi:MAG TPA: signal peptidase I [Actinomycetota bacterium]|nr:signal peptidase I [Actinomycetota bacterium]